MRKLGLMIGAVAVAIGFAVETQAQVTLNVNVRQQGNASASIMVLPSSVVNYEIVGTLATPMNSGHMGLALVSGTVDFSGGALTQANANDPVGYSPSVAPDGTCTSAMANFAKPWGITNPAGYKGTEINGDLVQTIGGQNTIKNIDSADFPIGVVKTGVAATGTGCGPATLLTGSITMPAIGGPFTLNFADSFANVIGPGQFGTEEFWATLAVGTINVSPLTITLQSVVVDVNLIAREPLSGKTLDQTKKNRVRLTFGPTNLPGNPGAGEVTIREMIAGGGFGSDLSSNFTITASTNVLTLLDNGVSPTVGSLGNKKWYLIQSSGTYTGVADFCAAYATQFGDADAVGTGLVNFADLSNINLSIGQVANDTNRRRDVDGSGIINFADMSAANTFIPTGAIAVARPGGHAGTCP